MSCCAAKNKDFKDENDQIKKKNNEIIKKKPPKKSTIDKFGPKDSNQQRIGQRYRFPADLKRAMVHLKAKKFGFYNQTKQEKEKNKTIVICPCCNSCIYTEEISIWEGTTDPIRGKENPFLLSFSSSLLFSFIKMSALYLLIIFLVCGLYDFVSSLDGNYCGRNPNICNKTFFQLTSTYNKYNDPKTESSLRIHNILCLVAVVISIIFFLIYKRVTHTLYTTINKQFYTQDDYTIFVQNIPIVSFKGQGTQIDGKHQKRIKQLFDEEIETWLKTLDRNNEKGIEKELTSVFRKKDVQNPLKLHKVTSISMCYDLSKYQKQRKLIMKKHLEKVKDPNYNDDNVLVKEIQTELKALNQMELSNAKRFIDRKDINFHLSHFVGKSFVSFEYPHFRDYVLQRYKTGKQVFKINDQILTLSVAAHPTDINWANLNFSDSARFWRIMASHFIVAMVLVFSAGLLVVIDAVKLSGTKDGAISQEDETLNYVLSIVSGLLASLINKGIWETISILTDFEKHKTTTNMISSKIIKAIVAQFINSVLIFYLMQLFTEPPYLSSAGLVVQASTYMVVEGFSSIFFSALNIEGWVRYLKLLFKYGYITEEKMIEKEKDSPIYNYQTFFNEDYQLPTFDITGQYVKYLLQIYTCMFFSYLIPVGTLASFVIFSLNFWVDKFKLFKLCSKYKDLGYFLTNVITHIFEGSLLAFAFGNLIFSSTITPKNAIDPVNFISVLLALAYLLFSIFMPPEVEDKILGQDANDEIVLSYSECLGNTKFTETYWSQNPATTFFEEEDLNNPSIFFKPKSFLEIFGQEHIEKLTRKKRYGDNFVETLI